MDEAFLGEIFLIAFNYAPPGFEFCNGQTLSIAEYPELFSLLGTTYGGNGVTDFGLPNLQGRTALCTDGTTTGPYSLGTAAGASTKPLTAAHISNHTHSISPGTQVQMKTGTAANTTSATGAYPAPAIGTPRYSNQADDKMIALNVSDMVTPQGAAFTTEPNTPSNAPVNNMMPSLCMNYVIATQGLFPIGAGKSTQQIGDVIMAAFTRAPNGYALCKGDPLPINQWAALFSILGTQYGGNGITNFNLPNLVGRVPLCAGQGPGLTGRPMAVPGGVKEVTLTAGNLPPHSHVVREDRLSLPAGDTNNTHNPVGAFAGTSTTGNLYSTAAGTGLSANMPNTFTISNGTPAPPVDNMQPYLAINYFIALTGYYPSRS